MARKQSYLDIVARFIGGKKAAADAEQLGKTLEETGKKGQTAGRSTTETWQQASDIFGDFLPRSLQRTTRLFFRNERAIKRTSLSFGGLKKAITATGIGALVTLIGTLIAYSDEITAFFNEFRIGAATTDEAVKKATEATNQLTVQTSSLISIARDNTASMAEREQALKSLSKEISGVADLDLQTAEGIERLNELIDLNTKKTKQSAEAKAIESLVEERYEKVAEASFLTRWWHTRQLEKQTVLLDEAQEKLNATLAEENAILEEIESAAKILEIQNSIIEDQEKHTRALRDARLELNSELDAEEKKRQGLLNQQEDMNAAIADAEQAYKTAEAGSVEQANAERELFRLLQERELLLIDIDIFEKEAAVKRAEQAARDAENEAKRVKSLDNLLAKAERAEEKLTQTKEEQQVAQLKAQMKADLEAAKQLDASEEQLAIIRASYRAQEDALLLAMAQRQSDKIDKVIGAQQKVADEIAAQGKSQHQLEMERLKRERDERLEVVAGNLTLENQVHADFLRQRNELIEQFDKEARQARLQGTFDLADAFSQVMAAANAIADDSAEKQRRLAIFNVLLSQAQSLASAIQGATQAAAATGPAAPFTFATYLAQMVGAVVGGFAQIKNIMSQANAPVSAVGGGVAQGGALTPTIATTGGGVPGTPPPLQAYVVESQLSFEQKRAASMRGRTTL